MKTATAAIRSKYNGRVANSRWKVIGRDSLVVANLWNLPDITLGILRGHYQEHRHAEAALPLDLLAVKFWVPGLGPQVRVWGTLFGSGTLSVAWGTLSVTQVREGEGRR